MQFYYTFTLFIEVTTVHFLFHNHQSDSAVQSRFKELTNDFSTRPDLWQNVSDMEKEIYRS